MLKKRIYKIPIQYFNKQGFLQGPHTKFYENNRVDEEGYYNNSNPVGIWKFYSHRGFRTWIGFYKNNSLSGVKISFSQWYKI